MTPALLISGFSDTGKTTLMSEIIDYLTKQGLKVAAIKNSHVDVDCEPSGKDTDRFRQMGAAATGIAGKNATVLVCHNANKENKAESVDSHPGFKSPQWAPTVFGDFEIILIEGCKKSDSPKIALIRSIEEIENFSSVEAFVTTDEDLVTKIKEEKGESFSTPLFHRNDLEGICQFVHQWWQKVSSVVQIDTEILLSDGHSMDLNTFAAKTVNTMTRGLICHLRGYDRDAEYKIDCTLDSTTVSAIYQCGKEENIALIPFIADMINGTLRGFLSTLKGTDGKTDSFTILLKG